MRVSFLELGQRPNSNREALLTKGECRPMTDSDSRELWQRIVRSLEEKLQFGFLEQERSVVAVRFDGADLTLVVSNSDAADFFRADVNQQRLIIVSRGIVSIEKITVELVEASPLS